jgi:hypothetical protein
MKIILQSYSHVTERIHAVMTWLRNLKARAALCRYTHLGPVLCNVTRWSSMKKMIDWYFNILEPISSVVPVDLQLSPGDNRMGRILQQILADLDTTTIQFQNEDLLMYNVRDYLDVAIQAFPELSVLKAGLLLTLNSKMLWSRSRWPNNVMSNLLSTALKNYVSSISRSH